MATFQPILNQSSTKPFISPGVQDNSMAQLIGDLGKMGVEAYTGYQGAQLEGAIEQETLDFFSQNQAYDEGVQAGIDAGGLEEGFSPYFQGMPEGIEGLKGLETKNKEFEAKLDKYASAMKQGKMSADQLYARIISTTREHVSRNPWLQKELLKTADNYLELTGLGGYIKEAQKNAKETADFQAKIVEQEAKYAATVGIDPLTDPLWMDKTRQRRVIISNYEDKKKQLEMIKEMRPGMLGNLISNMEQLRPATFMSLQDKAVAITTSLDQNGKPLPWDVQKMQLQNLWNTYVSDTRSAFVRADPTSISDPNVSEYLKWMGEESKNFIGELQNMKSGEEATKWLENRQKLVSAQEKLVVSGEVNRDAIQVFGSMIQYMPEPARNRVLSLMLPQTMSAANSIFSKVAPLDMTTSALPVLDVILEAGKAGRPIGTELGAFIQSSTKGINDPNIVKTPIEKLNYLKDINARMASINELANLKQLSPEDREAAVKLTQEYKDTAMFNAQKQIEDSGLTLEWNQLPNGDFTLTYAPGSKKDDAALAKLNNTFAGHINNAHKALSHLYGRTDYTAVAKELFMGEVTTRPRDSIRGNNPGNLKDTKGNFRTFSSIEDGIEAGENQILRYLTLGSPINGQPVSTIKDIVDNWRPASDRRGEKDISQEAYYKEVSNLSGIPLGAPVAPTKENIARIFRAISQVEGNSISSPVVPSIEDIDRDFLERGAVPNQQREKKIDHSKVDTTLRAELEAEYGRGGIPKQKILDNPKAFTAEELAEANKVVPISPEFAKELRNPKPKQQMDIREESRKKFYDTLKMTLASTQQSSPLLKKNPTEDAIESVSYIQALDDIPVVGPAVEAALIAFGFTNAIPALAKRLPKAMAASGKVVPTSSNVVVAGGNAGASRTTANIMMREASKAEVAKAKELYQQFWKTEWKLGYPKTDLEWSNAIGEANRWVATKMDKSFKIKSMEKK